ncbi:MAG TPA: BrnT family toxin [Pyrinomonadaceae bacterium]
MRFEWDEAKRRSNLYRHGIDFNAIKKILVDPTISVVDDRFDYGEMRLQTFGLLNGKGVVITHTETDDVMRVISIRKATKHEEKTYFRKINDRRNRL